MIHPKYIYGIHDPGGEHLMTGLQRPGWIVFTHELGYDPTHIGGCDYRPWTNQGLGAIARLNCGYSGRGTIPQSQYYDKFAIRVRNWVAASNGCSIWVIGNEPNHAQERPDGMPITPAMYADCFVQCERAIHSLPGHATDQVVVAAVAPWNNQTTYTGNQIGDWVVYFEDVLKEIEKRGGAVGAISIHTYTHGSNPDFIKSQQLMNAPFGHRHFQFYAYRDFMNSIPHGLRHLPVYITETDQDNPWENVNRGWVQNAYREIDSWNNLPGSQQIRCLVLYRWHRYDRWGFDRLDKIHDDFRVAISAGYTWKTVSELDPNVEIKAPLFYVCVNAVNVRTGPGAAEIVGQVTFGTPVLITGEPRSAGGLRWWPICTAVPDKPIAQEGWMADTTGTGIRLLAPQEMGRTAMHLLDWPIDHQYPITQRFGENPAFYKRFSYNGIPLNGHNGIDIGAPIGVSVTSAAAGTVRQSDYDAGGFGHYIVIEHPWGQTLYAHLSKRLAIVNQVVTRGESIGLSGTSGISTGPHLHFGVRVFPYRREDGWGGYCNPLYLFVGG